MRLTNSKYGGGSLSSTLINRKRKGFTLIELLAVIVVLAIIALITIPLIINVIDKSKKNAFIDSAYGIIEAGRLYYVENTLEKDTLKRYDFEVQNKKFVLKEDSTKTLKFTGTMPETGMLQLHTSGNIAIAICNNSYCACKSASELKVAIKDTNCNINSETGEIEKEDSLSEQRIKALEEKVDKMKLEIYPVGSIYISTSDKNPAEYIGGTWEHYGQGRTLMGSGNWTDINGVSQTFKIGQTGGEYHHVLTKDELPTHTHGSKTLVGSATFRETSVPNHDTIMELSGIFKRELISWSGSHSALSYTNKSDYYINSLQIDATHVHAPVGNNMAHNNVSPYITVYFFKRVS